MEFELRGRKVGLSDSGTGRCDLPAGIANANEHQRGLSRHRSGERGNQCETTLSWITGTKSASFGRELILSLPVQVAIAWRSSGLTMLPLPGWTEGWKSPRTYRAVASSPEVFTKQRYFALKIICSSRGAAAFRAGECHNTCAKARIPGENPSKATIGDNSTRMEFACSQNGIMVAFECANHCPIDPQRIR